MQETVLSPTKTIQKTSDSHDGLHFDDKSSLLPLNAFILFDTRFESENIEKKPWRFKRQGRL